MGLFKKEKVKEEIKKKTKKEKQEDLKKKCSVEYYPVVGKYFPKFKGQYICKNNNGIYIPEARKLYCESFSSAESAKRALEKFLEQHFGVYKVEFNPFFEEDPSKETSGI